MIAGTLLKTVGKVQSLVFALPFAGEPLVRSINRAVAYAAFYAPFLGGTPSHTLAGVRDGWVQFLKRAGINIRITGEEDNAFDWEVDQCPYGYCQAMHRGVCDAVMDLDRTYTRLLGGELTITSRIPNGSTMCRYTTRLRI